MGRRRSAGSRPDSGRQPVPRSWPRSGARVHQAIPRSVGGKDLDPQWNRPAVHRPALGRRRSSVRSPALLSRIPGADHYPGPTGRASMIQTIRIGHLLREALAAPYRNLVARPTGAAVRTRIEETLARSNCLTALLDFSEIELVDLSCADEVVAKLLLAGRSAYFFVLQGLREDHHEAIDHVLTHHRLAAVAVPPDKGEPRLLGWVPSDAREAFACICDRGPLRVPDLARAMGWLETRSRDPLGGLAARRLGLLVGEVYLPLPTACPGGRG